MQLVWTSLATQLFPREELLIGPAQHGPANTIADTALIPEHIKPSPPPRPSLPHPPYTPAFSPPTYWPQMAQEVALRNEANAPYGNFLTTLCLALGHFQS